MSHTKPDCLHQPGGDNNLAVIMAAYQPTSGIQCRGLFLPVESCEDILEDMPVTSEVEVFGPQSDTTAKVWLPQAVESGKLITAVFLLPWFQFTSFLIETLCRRHSMSADDIRHLPRLGQNLVV